MSPTVPCLATGQQPRMTSLSREHLDHNSSPPPFDKHEAAMLKAVGQVNDTWSPSSRSSSPLSKGASQTVKIRQDCALEQAMSQHKD